MSDVILSELDEELLNQIAEASVAPAGEDADDIERRTKSVAEVKARLQLRKGDLEKGIGKKVIRKAIVKSGGGH